MTSNEKSYLKIVIKANEYLRADALAKNIKEQIGDKASCSLIFMPKSQHAFTVQDSPHAYGATRSTFSYDEYKASMIIGYDNNIDNAQFNALVLSIKEAKAVPGTFIKIQVIKKTNKKHA